MDREGDQSTLHKDADTHEEPVKGENARSVMNTGGGPDRPTTPDRESAGASEPSQLHRIRDRTFRTFDGTAYTYIDTDHGPEMMAIRDRRFRSALRRIVQEETGERPPQAPLTAAIESLEARASRSPIAEVHVRVALVGGRVYLDLADDRGRAVEVGPDGWNVVDSAPVHFMRPARIRSLPVPERGGSIDDLRSIVNVVDDGDFVLFVAWLLDALRNDGAHPVLVINGGEGTAKTTLVEMVQELVDPSWAALSGLPSTERQLLEKDDRYLRAYDNVSSIYPRISDAVCRLSTGKPAHPQIINGIGELVMRPDLADRSLFVNLAPVADRQRRSLQEIWTTFERSRPRILGVLLDVVAHGLRDLPTTHLDAMPRMADFALWGTACEGALWPKGTFMSAYVQNRTEAAEKLIETDLVATAVRLLMAKRSTWSGTATELDGLLRAVTGTLEDVKGWPAEPRILSTRLRSLAPSLGKLGIMVTFDKVGHDRKRVVTLSWDWPDPPVELTQPASTGGAEPQAVSDPENGNEISSVRNVRNHDVEPKTPADDAGAADDTEREVQTPISGDHAAAADAKESESSDGAKVKTAEQSTEFDSGGPDGGRHGPRPPPRNPRTKYMEPLKRFGRTRSDDEEAHGV